MDSKKLEILMTAIDLGSFTKASEVVGYTQSGLTHMMDALEREVGFSLLQRDHNGIQLSPQGRQLMPAIREFLQAKANLENQINAIAEANHVQCMVGCMLETKVAIAAGVSLVAAKQNITEADCASFMYAVDPEMGMPGGFAVNGGVYTLSDKPGLGIDIDF